MRHVYQRKNKTEDNDNINIFALLCENVWTRNLKKELKVQKKFIQAKEVTVKMAKIKENNNSRICLDNQGIQCFPNLRRHH